jgi:hypothetical protein
MRGVFNWPPLSQHSLMPVAIPPLTILEVGESSKEGDLDAVGLRENGEVGDVGYSEVVQSAMEIYPFLGISCGGNEKRLRDLLTVLDKGKSHEVVASISKSKGSRELKIWSALFFDTRGDGSSRGKGKRVHSM